MSKRRDDDLWEKIFTALFELDRDALKSKVNWALMGHPHLNRDLMDHAEQCAMLADEVHKIAKPDYVPWDERLKGAENE